MHTLQTSFLFDLDGTLVDTVYEHVLAWHQALQSEGIELAVWRIHRKIGMSGGLFTNMLLREIGAEIDAERIERLQRVHASAFNLRSGEIARANLGAGGEFGSAEITDHERVASQHEPGFVGAYPVGDEQRDVFGRMAGRIVIHFGCGAIRRRPSRASFLARRQRRSDRRSISLRLRATRS